MIPDRPAQLVANEMSEDPERAQRVEGTPEQVILRDPEHSRGKTLLG